MQCNRVAILSSIRKEIDVFKEIFGSRQIGNKEILLAIGGVGKSSAAGVTQKVISEKHPDMILYTGFAGALDPDIMLGDVAIVSAAIDAEMDARAFDSNLKVGEYPFTGERVFKTHPGLVTLALESPVNVRKFDGFVATTSIFMDSEKKKKFMDETLPQLEADVKGEFRFPNMIDMECSAVVAVANANQIPCLVIRTISNTTQGDTVSDYKEFLHNRVEMYFSIVQSILENVDKVP